MPSEARAGTDRMLRCLILVWTLGTACVAWSDESSRTDATEALWSALRAGNDGAVARAIDQGADLASRGDRGDAPLHFAVRLGRDPALIRRILDGGADPNALNDRRQTPLVVALFSGTYDANPAMARQRTEVASLLLDRGANPRDLNEPPQNLLEKPLDRGEGRLVSRLLDAGGVLPDDALMRAMLPASMAADPQLLPLVIARSTPAQFHYRDVRGFSAAHRALWSNKTLTVLDGCIAAGVTPDAKAEGAWTLVHEAAWVGNVDALEKLAAHGARLDARTDDERTALHIAAGVPHPRAMEWLLGNGLERSRADAKGRRPLDHFLHSRLYRLQPSESLALVQALGGTEADLAAREQHPDRAMFEAISRNDIEAVKARIASGGNVNSVDENGSTPLSRALRMARGQFVTASEQAFGKRLLELLLAHGADPSLWIPAEDKTHLDFAREMGMEKELERVMRRRR